MIDSVRISSDGREKLIRLKRYTGIQHWNTLGRWALCASLRERSMPNQDYGRGENAIEIAWKVFGGSHADLFWAALQERCRRDGLPTDDATVAAQLRLHLHRGIAYLAGDPELRSVRDLIVRAVDA